ncbi:uncharacterized protein FIBRA_07467 [Fibroporia radiculosa]|uniref:Uncharacterized protein n=1 Tax=Fibroporia radiculosa TaxID=599839 RepID=J4I0Q8_9APHY|nr:uncharacterized protein FIBRA_07467 [Fibroporia radiculosa]CCM05257.1 predicted protein [Fibroporia radiculosa]
MSHDFKFRQRLVSFVTISSYTPHGPQETAAATTISSNSNLVPATTGLGQSRKQTRQSVVQDTSLDRPEHDGQRRLGQASSQQHHSFQYSSQHSLSQQQIISQVAVKIGIRQEFLDKQKSQIAAIYISTKEDECRLADMERNYTAANHIDIQVQLEMHTTRDEIAIKRDLLSRMINGLRTFLDETKDLSLAMP